MLYQLLKKETNAFIQKSKLQLCITENTLYMFRIQMERVT
jgi:hypothetical protein